jgi:hypothetical protein
METQKGLRKQLPRNLEKIQNHFRCGFEKERPQRHRDACRGLSGDRQ